MSSHLRNKQLILNIEAIHKETSWIKNSRDSAVSRRRVKEPFETLTQRLDMCVCVCVCVCIYIYMIIILIRI